MIKKILKFFAGVLALAILLCVVLYAQDPNFWDRYYMLVKNGGILPQEGWSGSEYSVGSGEHQFFEVTDSSQSTISTDALSEVVQYVSERNTSSLLVWHRGKLLVREHFQGNDKESLVIGKSMSKMVVSVVIGRAIKEGYIAGLDEPAATYIEEWQGTEKDQITIRHLLHMAAGFEPFYTLSYNPFGNFMRSYIAGHNERTLIKGYELIAEPGTEYDYSQAVSDLLGLILERATDRPYGQYLAESLIQPIGSQGGEVMMNRPNGLAHTGCCLLLPSESWLRIGLFLMNGGVIEGQEYLPTNWMADYLEPSPANPAMGLHIWLAEPYLEKRSWTEVGEPKRFGVLHSEPYLASDLFLFDGSGHQVVYIIPSEELVIVRTGGFTFATGNEWDNSYLPNTLIRGISR